MASKHRGTDADQDVLLRYGTMFYERKSLMDTHGGVLCLKTTEISFQEGRIGRVLNKGDLSFALPLSAMRSLGVTPKWGPPPARRFLRLDDHERSYLFLFSVTRPHWKQNFIDTTLQASPEIQRIDGWGYYSGE